MELCVFYLLIFTSVWLIQLLEGEVLGFSIEVSGDLGRDTACVSAGGSGSVCSSTLWVALQYVPVLV